MIPMQSSKEQFILERLQYLFEEKRLKSFNRWLFDDNSNCSAKKMAEAGFVYKGNANEPDYVQCFLCNKALDGWEYDDDPWNEHLKHSPNCAFVQLGKAECSQTVPDILAIKEALLKTIFVDYANTQLMALERKIESIVKLIGK